MTITSLLHDLHPRTVAHNIAIPHDEARMQYIASSTVGAIDDFFDGIGRYYQYHHSRCIAKRGTIALSEAKGYAKSILESEYRRRKGSLVSAYNDAHDGTNGGFRVILDLIAEALKAQAVENYIRDCFDRHVAPNSWDEKVNLIREFIATCGPHLSTEIQTSQPERYARDYEELIRAYVEALKSTASAFRRL